MITVFFTVWASLLSLVAIGPGEKDRIIIYGEAEILTTYGVDGSFIGVYQGRKKGFLKLNADGTGEYKYDIFGMAPASCERGAIQLIWGFVLNDKGEIIKNKRDYGFSYPIMLKSTGNNSFQGCRTPVMQDFILQRGNAYHVSSSDDWEKPAS